MSGHNEAKLKLFEKNSLKNINLLTSPNVNQVYLQALTNLRIGTLKIPKSSRMKVKKPKKKKNKKKKKKRGTVDRRRRSLEFSVSDIDSNKTIEIYI